MKDLRTIFLLESEANYPYKLIRREAMGTVTDHGKIALEQYITPHLSFVSHGINRILIFDHQQYLQQNFSPACSDLISCYDRIFHSATSLALQSLGIPHPSIIRTLDIIQFMSHTVRKSCIGYNIIYG